MTIAALTPLLLAALIKGAVFGALFGWLFPRCNTFLAHKMGRDPGPLQHVPFGGRLYLGLAILAGSGFALIDLIGLVSEAAGLPEMLRLAVMALFGLSAFGAVQIAFAARKPDAPAA